MEKTKAPAEAFFEESKIAGKLDFEHFCRTWGNFIQLDIAAILLYIDSHEHVAGIIGGTITPCTMTGDKTAMEAFWWVRPDLRGTTAGLRLFKAWEALMHSMGAVRIYIGNLTGLNNEAMHKLYKKLGYTELETHYVKTL